ncbi:hypothetical protein F9K33_15000 [bacterium]|nr:MAG: hypothetical protein F9K33_15000 [bacterium]
MRILTQLSSYRADWLDVGLTKIAVFFATLFLAKVWGPILGLEWYWYLILGIIASIKPFMTAIRWFVQAGKV